MEMTGAQILVEGMLREGVEKLFGYAGATICPLADVLRNTPQLDYTLVRNEQNAAHMASGYARISGKTGVCIVTSGPGGVRGRNAPEPERSKGCRRARQPSEIPIKASHKSKS